MGNKVAKWRDLNGKCYCKIERTTWEMWWKNGGTHMENKVAK